MVKFKPSAEQEAIYNFVGEDNGSLIVQAAAGSGKTTTIIGALKNMQGDVQLTAFNKKMADELSERTKKFYNVKCNTFHAIGLRALRSSNMNSDFRIDDSKVRSIVQRLDMLPKEFTSAIVHMVSLAKVNGFGLKGFDSISSHKSWLSIVYEHSILNRIPEANGTDYEKYGIELKDEKYIPMKYLVNCAIEALKKSNEEIDTIDFDDMIYLPLLKNCHFKKYDWFVIDEAQDTSLVRIEIAKRSLRENGRILAVGDSYQSIYFFSGADGNAMEYIKKEFNCKELPLSCCYRCGKNIIELAQDINPNIYAYEKLGKGEVIDTDDINVLYNNVKSGDVVLCRLTAPLIKLAFDLNSKGIPAKVEGKSQFNNIRNSIFSLKVNTMDRLKMEVRKRLTYLYSEFVKSPTRFQQERLVEAIERYSVVRVLYDEAVKKGIKKTQEFLPFVEELFEDFENNNNFVNLMTVHRSKGMEYDKVFVIHTSKTLPLESVDKTKKIQYQQELNLKYVAITRAKEKLYMIDNPIVPQNVTSLYRDMVNSGWAEYVDMEKING